MTLSASTLSQVANLSARGWTAKPKLWSVTSLDMSPLYEGSEPPTHQKGEAEWRLESEVESPRVEDEVESPKAEGEVESPKLKGDVL